VEDGAADELDVEVAHPGRPAGGLADDREGLGQDVVHGGALGELLLERGGLRPKLVVRQGLDAGLEVVDEGTRGWIFLRVRSLSVPNSLREIHLYIYHYLTESPLEVIEPGRGDPGSSARRPRRYRAISRWNQRTISSTFSLCPPYDRSERSRSGPRGGSWRGIQCS